MPHNFVLSMGSQAGIFALICATAILLYPLFIMTHRIYKTYDKQFYKRLSFPFLLGWTAWSFHSLLDINIQIPATAATAILITALMLAYSEENTSANPPKIIVAAQKIDRTKHDIITPRILFTTWNILAIILATTTIILSLNRIPGDIALQKMNNLCSPFNVMELKLTDNKIPMKSINAQLKACATLLPYSPFPWAMAGNIAQERGLWSLSERYYKEAILHSPKRACFYYNLALAQYKMGKIKQSLQNLKIAKRLFPYMYNKIELKHRRIP